MFSSFNSLVGAFLGSLSPFSTFFVAVLSVSLTVTLLAYVFKHVIF